MNFYLFVAFEEINKLNFLDIRVYFVTSFIEILTYSVLISYVSLVLKLKLRIQLLLNFITSILALSNCERSHRLVNMGKY